MRIFSALVLGGCLLTGDTLAQSPVGLTIDTQSFGAAVSPDFGVFSFETGSLQYGNQNYNPNGYFFSPTNSQLVALFQNIGARGIRIGGNSVDGAYIPSDSDMDSFFGFAQAAGSQVVFSLDLKNGNPLEDASEARYVWDNYRTNLICLAIGNEPDAYNDTGQYPAITNFSSYISTWQSFASAVVDAVPDVKLGGPDNDSAAIPWALDFGRAEQGVTNVAYVHYHFKPGGSANGLTMQQLIDGMLSSNMDNVNFPMAYNEVGATAQSLGLSYRFTEFNAFVAPTNNPPGEYTPFASALYAMDAMHWWAANGCLGLHFHTGVLGFLAAFYIDPGGNYQAYPICYGIAAFNVGGHGSAQPLTMTNAGGLNLTAYAVGDSTNLYVTIINKENGASARNASVTIAPGGFVSGSVAAMFLVQSNGDVGATNGVTLGGASLSGAGPWLGEWTALGSLTNGRCTVAVPAASAAVVRIQATTIFAPPVIVTNLPKQVLSAVGKIYQYSVRAKGGPPLSYQWYQGETPVVGQTNASYRVAAVGPGSNTYHVVVSNIYGATTSLVSTLTAFSTPTRPLAAVIEQLNPAGYWPMHELEAPAPGDVETNYGTLGLLGTGFYPDWAANGGGIVRQAPGPMSGNSDSDTSVHFTHSEITGTAVQFTNGVFVPHTLPLTTLNPPFSVECWFYPTNTSTGVDIWAQTGYEGLNAGNEGGVTGPICGIRLVWANATFVVYGYDNQFNLGTQNSDKLVVENSAKPINQWYHVVVTCDANLEFTLYVNGIPAASGSGVYSPDYWTPLSIGSGQGQTRSIAGYLSEFAVYTNVLPDVSYHYFIGTNASPTTNYFTVVTNDKPVIYLRMQSPAYTPPPISTWPLLNNLGTTNGVAMANGVYSPGTMPGVVPGPVNSNGVPFGLSGAGVAQLSGVSSYADAGYAAAYDPKGAAPFTVTAVFRGNPCDGRVQTIVGHSDNSWRITMNTNGTLQCQLGTNSSSLLNSAGVYNDGNWHQVVEVYTPAVSPTATGTNALYVDGVLDTLAGNVSTNGMGPGSSLDVLIGGDPQYTNNPTGVGRQFAGQVCEVAFFTNALAAAQIQEIYESAITPMRATLILTTIINAGNSQLQLTWSYGTLQTATNVAGPYGDILNALSPYNVSATNSRQFYRIREN